MAQSPSPASLDVLRGKFFVLDGSEGCGKSTQSRLLGERLESAGRSALVVRDPGTTRIGEQIRAILLDPAHGEMGMRCEMLLYMAARAQMMRQIILPEISEGKTVICDRFISSTLAYQLGGDGLTADDIKTVGDIAIALRRPDMTFILDMPVEQSMARVRRPLDRIEQRPREYHEQVRRNYLTQATEDRARYRIINAARPQAEVHEEIWTEILRIGRAGSGA